MVSRPGEGKQFTIVQRSGTGKLLDIIQKLMDTEAEASRPSRQGQYEIAPPNYEARVRRSQIISGRDCFVLELTPKSKSKYLIEGTAWVDKSTYGIVRLDGTTAASLSIWVGNPRVIDDFQQVRGIWLPVHTQAVSSTMLLGESRLEIRYTDHQVTQ